MKLKWAKVSSGETSALLGDTKANGNKEQMAYGSRWPFFGQEEKTAVLEVLNSSNVYAPIQAFEEEFAGYERTRFALTHNNGTSAVHAAYFAVWVRPDDELIVSAFTWHLQVSQILALHAIPVFCDIDAKSASIEPEDVERKISSRTRAVWVVRPYGADAQMSEIKEIARRHNLAVIEDCSNAHGSPYKGRKVGTIGEIGCFSF